MIAVSGIVPRLDELNNKAAEVNNRLELMCKQRGLPYISHYETIDPNKHWNESNLYLNSYGIRVFAENFSIFLSKSNSHQLKVNSENKESNREKLVLRISNMYGRDNSSTRTLNINRECEPMPAKNIDVTGSPHSANTILKNLCLTNVNRLICAQLNINSIRNKFESLKKIVSTNVDILLICKTKLDLSFPRAQFHIHAFGEPYRFDRNGKGSGILLYIRDDILSKFVESKMTIEGLFIEINLQKRNGFYAVLITQKTL